MNEYDAPHVSAAIADNRLSDALLMMMSDAREC